MVVVVASATADVISIINSSGLHSSPRSITSISSSSGLHSPSRSISSSSRGSINSSSSGRQNSTLAGGDHRVFVSVAASLGTSMQRVSSDASRASEHVSPSAFIHCLVG